MDVAKELCTRIPAQFRRTAKTASGKASIELWDKKAMREIKKLPESLKRLL